MLVSNSVAVLAAMANVLAAVSAAEGDESAYRVVGSFIFGRHNDRSAKPATVLSPLGASSQFQAGQFYRKRYYGLDSEGGEVLTSNLTEISALNKYGLFKNGDIYCEAVSSNVILFSHYAFLQGLYPPTLLDKSEYASYANSTLAWESNGTLSENPLNGYQYVNSFIQENATDGYIRLKGDENCPALNDAVGEAASKDNDEFKDLDDESKYFYKSLYQQKSFMKENFDEGDMEFANAMSIFDQVNVNIIHNATVAKQFDNATFARIKYYSDRYQWLISNKNVNANLTIGAQSLMGTVLSRLNTTKVFGSPSLNYFTGSFSTMYQLASVIGLDTVSDSFKTMPNYGATYVFEILNNTSNEAFVRFSFKNGTTDEYPLVSYPIFNNTDKIIPWNDFASAVSNISVSSVPAWCNACGFNEDKYSDLMIDMCVPYTETYTAAKALASKGANMDEVANGNYESIGVASQSGLTLAQAGGIGAGTTIGVFLILSALGFFGYKLFRKNKPAAEPSILPTSYSFNSASKPDGSSVTISNKSVTE